MPLVKQEEWQKQVDINTDPYGGCVVKVAGEVMRRLDLPEYKEFNTHKIICDAEHGIGEEGITGFMAGCIAQIVSHCHSRGEEFRQKWNLENGLSKESGEKANKDGGVINPAILELKEKQ